jgi:dienelactone hydrolase
VNGILRTMTAAAALLAFAGAARPADDEVTSKRAKQLVEALKKKDYAAATTHFGGDLKKMLDKDALARIWDPIIDKLGDMKKIGAPRIDKKDKSFVFVHCEFEKSKLDLRVHFDTDGKVIGFVLVAPKKTYEYKPPPYAKPDEYREVEVTVGEGGKWPLPGTLTLPKGKGPFALVVLVHGSGPNDRDETIGPNKPFRDLAWGLASQGVAVLRYVKRNKEHTAKVIEQLGDKFTVKDETIEDALLAVELGRKRKEIDPKRVFVLGHSLGGYVAPRIGAADPKIAGLIILAGNVRPLEDLLEEQYPYLLPLEGMKEEDVKKFMENLKKKTARVRGDLKADTKASDLPLGVPASYWLDLKKYDAAATAAKLKQPLLILQGERDHQVTMDDFELWKKGLKGHKDATLKSYPMLYHLFIEAKGKGKTKPDDYDKAGHVSKEVIDDVAAWVKKR